jgi:hypothetical protein
LLSEENRDTKEFTVNNKDVYSVYSFLMNNEAYKMLKDKMYNGDKRVYSGERASFGHFDINLANKNNEINVKDMATKYKKLVDEQNTLIGISAFFGRTQFSGMNISNVTDCPDIQFVELLSNYFDELSKHNNNSSPLLMNKGKKQNHLEVALNNIVNQKHIKRKRGF